MRHTRFSYRGQECVAIRHPHETEAQAVARSIQRREPRVHGVVMRLDSERVDGYSADYEARLEGKADRNGFRAFRNVWVTIYR